MEIEDIEEVGKNNLKITFVNDEAEEVMSITLKRSELRKLKLYIQD